MSDAITRFSVNSLKVHPRNTEFFDDISGKEYDQFKKSIEEEGVITPLIASNDMTLISGHQRLKACIDLGIKTIPVIIREDLDDEDEKLKVLLAANFGRLKNNEIKQRKVADEYVKLCGYKHGGSRDQVGLLNYDEMAKQLGTSKTSLKRALNIERKLTPELREMVDTGKVSKILASDILSQLPNDEQTQLLEDLGKDQLATMTQKQVQEYINQIKELENQVKGYKMKEESRSQSKTQNDPPFTQSNDTTIEELMEEKNKLEAEKRKEYERAEKLQKESEKQRKELEILKEQAKELREAKNSPSGGAGITDTKEYKDLLDKLRKTQNQLDTAQFMIKGAKPNNDIRKDFNIFELKELVHKFSNNISIYEYDPDIVNQGSLPDREDLLVAINELWEQLENISKNIKGVAVA